MLLDCGDANMKYPCNVHLLVTNSGQPHDAVVFCLSPIVRTLSLALGVLIAINYVSAFYSFSNNDCDYVLLLINQVCDRIAHSCNSR